MIICAISYRTRYWSSVQFARRIFDPQMFCRAIVEWSVIWDRTSSFCTFWGCKTIRVSMKFHREVRKLYFNGAHFIDGHFGGRVVKSQPHKKRLIQTKAMNLYVLHRIVFVRSSKKREHTRHWMCYLDWQSSQSCRNRSINILGILNWYRRVDVEDFTTSERHSLKTVLIFMALNNNKYESKGCKQQNIINSLKIED
jgi:hypothetical protein